MFDFADDAKFVFYKSICCPKSPTCICIWCPQKAMPEDSTVLKRQKLLDIYRGMPAYDSYVQLQQKDHSLPSTPRTTTGKREWEKNFFQWKQWIKACSTAEESMDGPGPYWI